MAIFRSFLLGDVKKSVANLTMYIANGVSIVRGKPLSVHNPRTEKQRIQRARMKALIGLVGGFGPVLPLGYPNTTGLIGANNRFVQDNMEAVTVDENVEVTVDFSKLVCSSGNLKVPKVSVSLDEAGKQFVFTQQVQQRTLTCNPTDIAWVVVYEKMQHESEIYPLKTRREGGEVRADLPEDWNADNCEFYTFARNQEGTRVSRTSYLQLTIAQSAE